MKILQIHNFYRTPGGECQMVRAEKELLEQTGHQVRQFTRDSSEIDRYSMIDKGRRLLEIPYSRASARSLAMQLRADRPDVAHVHNVFPLLSPSIYRALKQHGIPVVQTIHNFRFLCPNGQLFTQGRICQDCQAPDFRPSIRKRCLHDSRLTTLLYAISLRHAWKSGVFTDCIDRFIVLNRFMSDLLVGAGISRDRLRICSNFVSGVSLAPTSRTNTVLYLGRLSAEKGIWTLIEAFSATSGLQLVLAGTGPLEGELRQYVRQNPQVDIVLAGFVQGDEKDRLIRNALCTVVPSEWYEPFGVVAIESLARGTPVIASRIGGLAEVVRPGVDGMLFAAGDARDLADCLNRLAGQPELRDRMSVNAVQSVRERYSADTHQQQLLAIYTESITAAHRGPVVANLRPRGE